MPWTVTVIPDVVKGIAQAAGRDEALTGSNRTMIGVVQGAIIETSGLLDSPIGRLLSLADLYDQLASDVPIETKTDLNQIVRTVSEATAFTTRVARALFLLGEAEHIPTTLENVARSLVDSVDVEVAALRHQIGIELGRLVGAGYAKQIGDEFVFLNTQQRSFQEKVRARQEELQTQTYELSQALKDYDSEDALRFDKVPLHGREVGLKLEIDGRVVRNPTAHVSLRVFSPFQRGLDPQVADDTALRQRSAQDPDNILLRMAEVSGLHAKLALALATEQVAEQIANDSQSSEEEQKVARQARQVDLASHRTEVRRLLAQSVRGGIVFFRGTTYHLASGDSASAAVRATLGEILPGIYSRFSEVPHRLINEETAVKAALNAQTSNPDLQALGVYRADGTLNESHLLLSSLRGRLPLAEQDQGAINAEALRSQFERPPFGWDGNCVKVGLALLLRASACRLIENGRTLTDPSNPEVVLVLSREQRFKSLRVQGIRSELSVQELQQIRGYIEAIYGIKPALVPATLHNALGEKLIDTAQRAKNLQEWATTAQCQMPLDFEDGNSLVMELLNSSTPTMRLSRFLEQADLSLRFASLLDALALFRQNNGSEFLKLRDFYTSMANADVDLAEVRGFIDDWNTVVRERSVMDANRWWDMVQAYNAAQQALSNQITVWQEDTRKRLAEIEAGLAERMRSVGVPDEQMSTEVSGLSGIFQNVRERLERTGLSLSEIRGIMTALTAAEFRLPTKVEEAGARYQPTVPPTDTPAKPSERRLKWRDLLGQRRVASDVELDNLLGDLKSVVEAELRQHKTIIIE